MFGKLVVKTEVLGHQASFDEIKQDRDMPSPNGYAYYYGSFTAAAQRAWDIVRCGDSTKKKNPTSSASEASDSESNPLSRSAPSTSNSDQKQKGGLTSERAEFVVEQFVEMFIESDGHMPSQRMIKKNSLISEKEVDILRRSGQLAEKKIRALAEQKTGREFPDRIERMKQTKSAKSAKAAPEPPKPEVEAVSEPKVGVAPIPELPQPETTPEPETHEEVKIMPKRSSKKATDEEVKQVIREFAIENLRWPSDKEIHEFNSQGLPGWGSSADLYRRFGGKAAWAKQIFPEGLPSGFIVAAAKKSSEAKAAKTENPTKPTGADKPVKDAKPAGEVEPTKPEEIISEVVKASSTREVIIPVRIIVPEGVKISGTINLTVDF